jgi:hypothetical protein
MSLDKEDVKHGIDKAADQLKVATDKLAAKTHEASDAMTEKAKELARKTGDQMIEQGTKLKNAAS